MKIVGFPCSVDMSVGGRREVMVGVFLHDNLVRKRPESAFHLTHIIDFANLSSEFVVRKIVPERPLRARLSRESHIPTLSVHQGKKAFTPIKCLQ